MIWKKSSTLVSALGIALSATTSFAHVTTTTNNNLSVTIPESRTGFNFNISALALKPGASNLNYVIYNKALPIQSPTWHEKELMPSFNAAFAVGAGYVFPEGKDISLNWTHLNSTTTDSISAPTSSYFLGPDWEIGPNASTIRYANGNAQFRFDVINLDAGQTVNFGSHVETRFFAGLSNTYLREQVTTTYSGATITGAHQGPLSLRQEVTANYTGLGPRLGIGSKFITDSGFGIIGEAAASALIGYTYSHSDYITSSQQLKDTLHQNYNYQTIRDQNVTQVIPGFDAKLGALYKHAFNNGTSLTVEAGYQAAVYINAISQYIPASLVDLTSIDTGGIYVATMSHTLSNYSVQGPFLNATYQM